MWLGFWNYLVSFPYGLCAYAMLAAAITLAILLLALLGSWRRTVGRHIAYTGSAIAAFLLYFLLADLVEFLNFGPFGAFFMTLMGMLLVVGAPTAIAGLYLVLGPKEKEHV